jgi:hypothetical protein
MHALATQRSLERSAGFRRPTTQRMTWDCARLRTDGETDQIQLLPTVHVL